MANGGENLRRLRAAVCVRDVPTLRQVLAESSPADVAASATVYGDTLLHLAISSRVGNSIQELRKSLEVVKVLISTPGVDVMARGHAGMTALHIAAQNKRDGMVSTLLAVPGLDASAIDDFGRRALHYAAMSGSVNIVAMLIAAVGDGVDAVDKQGLTAYDLACHYDWLDCQENLRHATRSKHTRRERRTDVVAVSGAITEKRHNRTGTAMMSAAAANAFTQSGPSGGQKRLNTAAPEFFPGATEAALFPLSTASSTSGNTQRLAVQPPENEYRKCDGAATAERPTGSSSLVLSAAGGVARSQPQNPYEAMWLRQLKHFDWFVDQKLALSSRQLEQLREVIAKLRELLFAENGREVLAAAFSGALGQECGDIELQPYGGCANGFGGQGTDIDATLICRELGGHVERQEGARDRAVVSVLSQVKSKLEALSLRGMVSPQQIELICARVPVVKCRLHGLDIDITAQNEFATRNTSLLAHYAQCKSVQSLGLVVKQWAKLHGLVNPRQGWLTSYDWTLMVIDFAQYLGIVPCLQEHRVTGCNVHGVSTWFDSSWVPADNGARHHTLRLFHEFLVYYSEIFNSDEEVVSIRFGFRASKSVVKDSILRDKQADARSATKALEYLLPEGPPTFMVHDPFLPKLRAMDFDAYWHTLQSMRKTVARLNEERASAPHGLVDPRELIGGCRVDARLATIEERLARIERAVCVNDARAERLDDFVNNCSEEDDIEVVDTVSPWNKIGPRARRVPS